MHWVSSPVNCGHGCSFHKELALMPLNICDINGWAIKNENKNSFSGQVYKLFGKGKYHMKKIY